MGYQDSSRFLEIGFVNRMCFLRVRLVSGMFGCCWLDGEVYLLA